MKKLSNQEQRAILIAIELIDDKKYDFSCVALHSAALKEKVPVIELTNEYKKFYGNKRGSWFKGFEANQLNLKNVRVLMLALFLAVLGDKK